MNSLSIRTHQHRAADKVVEDYSFRPSTEVRRRRFLGFTIAEFVFLRQRTLYDRQLARMLPCHAIAFHNVSFAGSGCHL